MTVLPSNEIPDGETLFKYYSLGVFPADQDEIPLGIFDITDLSCDWQRFRSNPFTSFHIAEGKTEVIAITICDEIRNPRNPKRRGMIIAEWHQDIVHDPVLAEDDPIHGDNPAHSLIRGRKKIAIKEAIRSHSIRFRE